MNGYIAEAANEFKSCMLKKKGYSKKLKRNLEWLTHSNTHSITKGSKKMESKNV